MPVDKSSDRVRRMFGQIAGRYDFLNHLLSLGIDHYWRWRTVRRVPPAGALPILDRLHRHRRPGIRVRPRRRPNDVEIVGADFCHEMLEIGRQKATRSRQPTAASRSSKPTPKLCPFQPMHFKSCAVAFGLRNVADTDRGLAEMVRVTAPDGHVAVLEFSTPTWQPFKAIYGWYFRNVLPRIGQFFARDSSRRLRVSARPASANSRKAKRSPTACAPPASPTSVAIRSLSAWLHFM